MLRASTWPVNGDLRSAVGRNVGGAVEATWPLWLNRLKLLTRNDCSLKPSGPPIEKLAEPANRKSGAAKSPPPSMSIFTEAPARAMSIVPLGRLEKRTPPPTCSSPPMVNVMFWAPKSSTTSPVANVTMPAGPVTPGIRRDSRPSESALVSVNDRPVVLSRRNTPVATSWRPSSPTIDRSPTAARAYVVGCPVTVILRSTMRVLDSRKPVAAGLRDPSSRLSGPDPTNSSRPSPVKLPVESKAMVPSIVTKSPIVMRRSPTPTSKRSGPTWMRISVVPTVTVWSTAMPVVLILRNGSPEKLTGPALTSTSASSTAAMPLTPTPVPSRSGRMTRAPLTLTKPSPPPNEPMLTPAAPILVIATGTQPTGTGVGHGLVACSNEKLPVSTVPPRSSVAPRTSRRTKRPAARSNVTLEPSGPNVWLTATGVVLMASEADVKLNEIPSPSGKVCGPTTRVAAMPCGVSIRAPEIPSIQAITLGSFSSVGSAGVPLRRTRRRSTTAMLMMRAPVRVWVWLKNSVAALSSWPAMTERDPLAVDADAALDGQPQRRREVEVQRRLVPVGVSTVIVSTTWVPVVLSWTRNPPMNDRASPKPCRRMVAENSPAMPLTSGPVGVARNWPTIRAPVPFSRITYSVVPSPRPMRTSASPILMMLRGVHPVEPARAGRGRLGEHEVARDPLAERLQVHAGAGDRQLRRGRQIERHRGRRRRGTSR